MRKKKTERFPVFGKVVGSFREGFPEIENVWIEFQEKGIKARHANSRKHSGPEIREFIACSNPHCKNGGFRIWSVLERAVESMPKPMAELRDDLCCIGREISGRDRNCLQHLAVKVRIEYKNLRTGKK